MVADYLAFVLPLLTWVATYLLHSTCLFGGVWLFLRLRPTCGPLLREGLWKSAVIGGVLTATLQTLCEVPQPFGDVSLNLSSEWLFSGTRSQGATPGDSSRASTPLNIATPESSDIAEGALTFEEIALVDTAQTDNQPRGEVPGSAGPSQARRDTGSLSSNATASAWLLRLRLAAFAASIGIAFLATIWGLARCLKQTLAFRRRLTGCGEVFTGRARHILDELCAELPHPRRVRLLSAADDPEPAAFGIRQWTIVLPSRAEQDLAEDELRALLAHELAHLVRGDVAWLGVWRVVCSCFAFQPLNHLARREWQRAAEWLCDNWAVHRTGSRLALAKCLAEVAGWRLGPAATAPSLAATGTNHGLASRIERLLDETPLADAQINQNLRQRLGAAGGLLLIALVCCAPRISLSMPRPERGASEHSPANTTKDVDLSQHEGAVQFLAQSIRVEDLSSPSDAQGAGDFAQLDREWFELAAELAALEPLLQRQGLTAAERAVAERLARQIAALKSRHAELARIRERSTSNGLSNFSTQQEKAQQKAKAGRLMFGVGVNSDSGASGAIVLDEANFDLGPVESHDDRRTDQ